MINCVLVSSIDEKIFTTIPKMQYLLEKARGAGPAEGVLCLYSAAQCPRSTLSFAPKLAKAAWILRDF